MPTLVLLRHAKAEAAGPSDFERKLSAPGRSQARRVAAHLVAAGLAPDVVLCSAALRARQTWEQVAAGLTERGHPGETGRARRRGTVLGSPADRGRPRRRARGGG